MDKNTDKNILLDDPEFLANVLIGIGEASTISGVPQRQIRYWESKKIIKSIVSKDSKTRRYNYLEIKKIILFKELLDEGYTLEAAAIKLKKRVETLNNAFLQIKKSLKK